MAQILRPQKDKKETFSDITRQNGENAAAPLFWLEHFVTFQICVFVGWLALILKGQGFARTPEVLRAVPILFVIMFVNGVVGWVPHAVLALAYRKMRQTRAMATAVVGSVVSWVGRLYFSGKVDGAWLPLLLSIVLSLTAVWLFVRLRSSGQQNGK